MGKIFSVSDAVELSAAIDVAQGGDRIQLAAGEYGVLRMDSETFAGPGLTIASADRDALAVFDKVELYRSENIHFDRIEIDFDPTDNTGYKTGFRAAEGKDVSITNSVLQGGSDPAQTDPDYVDSPVGIGVQMQAVDDVVIDNNEISDFHAGINVAYVDGLKVTNNHVSDMRTSPLTGGGLSNVEVIGNHFESSHPVNLARPGGDHADMIHFYPLTNQNGPMENIVIRDNFLEQGTGTDPILGIYIDDAGGGGSGLGYRDVVIENNIIHNGDAQGIRVENIDGLRIVDNSLLQSSGGGLGSAPGMVLVSGTRNVVIDNNIIAGQISGSSIGKSESVTFNVDVGDNLFVQDRDPFGENYVGDLLTNGLTANGDISDFMPLDGSAAEGYGARLVQFDSDTPGHAALVSDTRGEYLDLRTITFDLKGLFDEAGQVSLSGAEIVWDFGDGNTASGDDIAHRYDSAGSYDVTATITLAGGDTVTVDHTTHVFSPEAVRLDFETGHVDTSDIYNRVQTIGDVDREQGRFGDALRLVEDTAKVTIGRSEEILDNPAFSISFAFQKDGGTATNSDNGMFSYFSGTSYISTGEGSINFSGSTSTGRSIRMRAEDDSIEDGNWHHVTYTFSSATRSAVLYLDGEEVDRMDNLTGIQHTTDGHDLLLGGRVGGAFGGLLDEFEFTRAALTAEDVSARYETLFDLVPGPVEEEEPEEEEDEDVVVSPPEPEPKPEPEQPDPEPEPEPEQPEPDPEPEPEQPEPDPEPEQPEPEPEQPGIGFGDGPFRLLTEAEERALHGGGHLPGDPAPGQESDPADIGNGGNGAAAAAEGTLLGSFMDAMAAEEFLFEDDMQGQGEEDGVTAPYQQPAAPLSAEDGMFHAEADMWL